jgi:hypothetical protein
VISTSTSTSLRAGLRASHPAQDDRIFDHELFVWLFIAAGTQLLLVSYNRRSGKATLMSCRACENDFAPVQAHEIARFSEFVLPIVQAKRQIRFVFLIPPAHGWPSMPWLPVRRKFLQLRNTRKMLRRGLKFGAEIVRNHLRPSAVICCRGFGGTNGDIAA